MRLTIGQMCSHWSDEPGERQRDAGDHEPAELRSARRARVLSHSPAHIPSIIVASVGMKLSVDQPPC